MAFTCTIIFLCTSLPHNASSTLKGSAVRSIVLYVNFEVSKVEADTIGLTNNMKALRHGMYGVEFIVSVLPSRIYCYGSSVLEVVLFPTSKVRASHATEEASREYDGL